MPDAYSDKNVIRTKTFLFVADLSHKGSRFHGKKSQLYMWNLLIVIALLQFVREFLLIEKIYFYFLKGRCILCTSSFTARNHLSKSISAFSIWFLC
jgi:hypothetical protein